MLLSFNWDYRKTHNKWQPCYYFTVELYTCTSCVCLCKTNLYWGSDQTSDRACKTHSLRRGVFLILIKYETLFYSDILFHNWELYIYIQVYVFPFCNVFWSDGKQWTLNLTLYRSFYSLFLCDPGFSGGRL